MELIKDQKNTPAKEIDTGLRNNTIVLLFQIYMFKNIIDNLVY